MLPNSGATGVAWHFGPVVVADSGISDAFGSLEIAMRLSIKDIPKTTNGLAYTAGL